MKKHIAIAAGLAVLSGSAYATKARMSALGQDSTYGSHYLSDTRNVFRNAAEVNGMSNYVVTEWGTNANAEGGFFREAGAFNYGLYMGNEAGSYNTQRGTASILGSTITANSFMKHDNALDLFFGGDMGVEWGARVHYASGTDEQTAAYKKEHSALGVGLGMKMGDLSAYANMALSDESKGADAAGDKFEGNGLMLGASYGWSGYTFFAEYNKSGYEVTPNGVVKGEYTETDLTVGAAKVMAVSSTSRWVADFRYNTNEAKTKNVAGAAETKSTTKSLPLRIAFEMDSTSWLTLRGSVAQNTLMGSNENNTGKEKTTADSTSVAAGATLNFGKLKVDGTLEGGTNGSGNEGKLNATNLMANVAVHYWF